MYHGAKTLSWNGGCGEVKRHTIKYIYKQIEQKVQGSYIKYDKMLSNPESSMLDDRKIITEHWGNY